MILSVDQLNSNLAKYITDNQSDNVLVITSKAAKFHCLPHLFVLETFEVIEVPNGDSCKTIDIAQFIWSQFQHSKLTRKSTVIAIGGGSVLDLTGFCASTYMRGINVVYVPTTLLALVDSAEGGKTGINFGQIKNLIGTFNQPNLILNSSHFLDTLPKIELLSGWAEIVKHGILEGQFIWNSIQDGMFSINDTRWNTLIEHNIRFKKSIVETDYKESGQRKLLNLGHTIGHALEALHMMSVDFNHGICVANGIVIEAQIALALNLSEVSFVDHMSQLIWQNFPKIEIIPDNIPELLKFIRSDKKNNNQNINFTLPVGIGKVKYDIPVDEQVIINVLKCWN